MTSRSESVHFQIIRNRPHFIVIANHSDCWWLWIRFKNEMILSFFKLRKYIHFPGHFRSEFVGERVSPKITNSADSVHWASTGGGGRESVMDWLWTTSSIMVSAASLNTECLTGCWSIGSSSSIFCSLRSAMGPKPDCFCFVKCSLSVPGWPTPSLLDLVLTVDSTTNILSSLRPSWFISVNSHSTLSMIWAVGTRPNDGGGTFWPSTAWCSLHERMLPVEGQSNVFDYLSADALRKDLSE